MAVTVDKILSLAKSQIGTRATAVKKCKYNKAYYGSDVSGSGFDWCAVFIWWLFTQAGAVSMLYGKTASCGALAQQFYNKGKLYRNGFKAGDIVFFHWDNDCSAYVPSFYSFDHVGIIEKVNSNGSITTIEGNTGSTAYGEVMRRTRYPSQICGVARPDYEKSLGTPNNSSNNTSVNSVNQLKATPTVTYRVRTGGKWLPAVNNLEDFAGITGKAISDVAIKVSSGTVKYRVHIKGGRWLPYVNGYDTTDIVNGYAGNGTEIDAVEVYYFTPSSIVAKNGYLKAKYRVSPVNRGYYPYQYDDEKTNGQDGYAGTLGKSIDRLQIVLAK